MDTALLSNISNAIATPAENAGMSASGQIAALQARLKVLFKSVKSVGLDASLNAKAKKMMLQSLQLEIQMVMQRIAALQAGHKKAASPMKAVLDAAAESSREDRDEVAGQPHKDASDALNPFSENRVDITV